ncbi:MAG: hypothetical protein KJZ93_01995 [Caldilineaceae bacterium]|nr:hypothetical protein [Caldilineaceae bacterium]
MSESQPQPGARARGQLEPAAGPAPIRMAAGGPVTAPAMLHLQRVYGNRYVQRVISGSHTGVSARASHEPHHGPAHHRVRKGFQRAPLAVKQRPVRLSPSRVRVALDGESSQRTQSPMVSYVTLYLNPSGTQYIDFHTGQGLFRYRLNQEGLQTGEYQATVVTRGNDVNFTLDARAGGGRFSYNIGSDQPNPSTFFARQSSVLFVITDQEAPPLTQRGQVTTSEGEDAGAQYLSIEEAMRRCESGDLRGVKIFPYRGTRFGGAPIMAHRDGDFIIVRQPLNSVLGNSDFRAQTRTLPLETFIGGVRLRPNEIVRVHTYEPRWYHLNITGSTSGDLENEFCVTGEQMLQIAAQSTRATLLNIGLTGIDAATLFVPVGRLASMIGRPVIRATQRAGRNLAAAIMLGLRDASPTAFAGIASRTSTVLVEQQAVNQVAGRAVSQSIGHATVQFGERAVAQAAPRAVGTAGVGAGAQAATQTVARTVTVTAVDVAGGQAVSTLTTPTGDRALDAEINRAFGETFDLSTPSASSRAPQQGAVPVAPEIAAGFTQAEVQAFNRFLAKPMSHPDIRILQQLWDDAARAGDNALLTAANSRNLFNLHRNRFWARVRGDPVARAIFTDAGCRFSGGAPYYVLNGRRITMTIDHIIERQSAPNLALTASNLRITFGRENSVVLRLLHQLDPFQR